MADLHRRRPARFFFSLLFAAACAIGSSPASSQAPPPNQSPNQIDPLEHKLAQARAAGSLKDEADSLIALGALEQQAGEMQKALDFYNQALEVWRKARSRNGEALALDDIGRVYADQAQEDKALGFYSQALPIWREAGNRRGEALTLNNLGKVYSDLGQEQKALDFYNQALPIWREVGNRRGEASTLNNIGRVYSDQAQEQKALDFYNQALPMWREVGDRAGEALTLNNIGRCYSSLGQKESALNFYNPALTIWRGLADRRGEALTLDNIGRVYSDLGQKPKALEYYNQALPVWHGVGDRRGEALTLNDIGRAYSDLGEPRNSLEYYNQALSMWRDVGDHRGEAVTLNNLGRAQSNLGQKQSALQYYYQALPLWREVGEGSGEALTLTNLGLLYGDLGQTQQILPNEIAALYLAIAAGNPDLQGWIDASLMTYFRGQQRLEAAIFFGLDAVNSFQQIRRNISGLDQDLQSGFTQSKSGTYRELAELLVETDRLAEAEQVLDLLKEQELQEVVRGAGNDPAAKVQPVALTPEQQKAQSDLAAPEKTAAGLTGLNVEYAALLAKTARSPAEEARLKELDGQIAAGNGEVSAFFRNTLYPELAQKVGTGNANTLLSAEKADVSRLQNTLAGLGSRVLGIRILFGDEHAYAIVITPHTRERVELKATPAELRSKVLEVREDLRSPRSDPKPHLSELYAMVVAPMESQLKALEGPGQDRVPTLLWSLDGVLRYLPMAALYDGTHYMAERFNNVLFTPESYGNMAALPASGLRVLAMGLSKSYGGLPPLPGVLPELESVVHDPAVPQSHGPMDGKLLSDEQFTLAALKTELGSGNRFQVVHIASHFVEETGGSQEPYLMLGGNSVGAADGYQFHLSELEDSAISFHGTELLTLSACSTAKGDAAQDGLEMDSLGMIAQQKDAEAVLATLWDVNDASTSRLMSDFYTRWVKLPADGKAEALRQAQLAFLRGSTRSSPANGKAGRGFAMEQEPQAAGYSHPFYWAPFVLIGNFR